MNYRISKREFISLGGLAHPRLYRKQMGHAWSYWRIP